MAFIIYFFFQDIEFIRAHYAIEDFIYYNYHQREEHAHLFHFTVNPIFRHYTRHFLKVWNMIYTLAKLLRVCAPTINWDSEFRIFLSENHFKIFELIWHAYIVFQDVLRLSHKSCLYYSLYPKGVGPTMSVSTQEARKHMHVVVLLYMH